jgi:dienelactone hydrolase
MQDVLQNEERARGKEASRHLQFVLMTTAQLDDVISGLTFLKNLPSIDSHRIAMMGHSFGGQLTLLAAERDSSVRAAVAFGAAAASWGNSSEVRGCLLAAVRRTHCPIMFVHAANDYSTIPGDIMAGELAKLAKPHVLKIYPPVGKTSEDGHNFVYTGVDRWENDVFKFLNQQLRRRQGLRRNSYDWIQGCG